MRLRGKLIALCALATVLGAACVSAWAAEIPTLPEIAMGQTDLSTTMKAAQLAGAVNALKGCGPFTVFAPVDCAWAALTKPTADELLNPCNKSIIASILLYHAVLGNYGICDFENMKCCPIVLKTLSGGTVTVIKRDGCWYVDNAKILGEGIPAKNGMLFKIDKVMIPPGARVQ